MTFPKSLIIPSLLAILFVLCLWVSFLSCKFICIVSFLIPHVRDVIQYFSCIWLTSLTMTIVGPSLQQRDAVLISKIRYQVKEFSILPMGRCKPLDLLNSFLSYAPQRSGANPVPLFILLLAFPQSFAITSGIRWISFGSPHSNLEKSLTAVTFLVYWYGRRYFHFICPMWLYLEMGPLRRQWG